jgi:catechol 2,3-dioxygenase-like lactoylglutathione lyase family enzyme
MIQKIIPVLPATNIQDTIMFYESKLGFKAVDQGGYIVMKKGQVELHFFLSDDKKLCENSICNIKVSDIECLYIDLSALEIVNIKGALKDKPGGIKEFCVRDNNGNLLKFVQDLNYLP